MNKFEEDWHISIQLYETPLLLFRTLIPCISTIISWVKGLYFIFIDPCVLYNSTVTVNTKLFQITCLTDCWWFMEFNWLQNISVICSNLSVPIQFSSVRSLSRVRLFVTPWIAARQASLSITNSRSSLRLTSIESVMPSSHLILCHPLFLLPPVPPSTRVFSNESTLCTRWPKYWSFSFSIIPSKEIPGLISFRMDWLHLLAVQGTLKSLLQHHSSY